MPIDAQTLDNLHRLALSGDARAQSALFEDLRVRFLSLAKRRVQADHAEDVVQDALGIVFDRYGEIKQGTGILVWGLTVLRNVIGNHYQARGRERERLDFVEELPLDAGSEEDYLGETMLAETTAALMAAIAEMGRRFPRCARIFHGLLDSLEKGGSPNQVSSRALQMVQKEYPKMNRGSFYTNLHRCRAHLRTLMQSRQEGGNHVG
ncbi:MAG: RNA polymerase sigma factor [Candidatus Krumholzibacteriota bacterium]